MDPANFIVRIESPESMRNQEKQDRRPDKHKKLLKTTIRPHYVIKSTSGVRQLFRQKKTDKKPPHPVRGHWKSLISEFYKNKKDQILFIKQYFTGEGKIKGVDGKTYTVMIKESPTQIKPYAA